MEIHRNSRNGDLQRKLVALGCFFSSLQLNAFVNRELNVAHYPDLRSVDFLLFLPYTRKLVTSRGLWSPGHQNSAARSKVSSYRRDEIASFHPHRGDPNAGFRLKHRLARGRKGGLEARCLCYCKIQWRGPEILEHVSLREEGPPLGASLEALLAPQHQRAGGLRARSADRQAAWRRGRVVGFRCAGSTAGNFRMERAQRRAIAARVLPPRQGWSHLGIANPPETRRQAHVLICGATRTSGDRRRNTRECQAPPARLPRPRNRQPGNGRNRRHPPPAVRTSVPRATSARRAVACRARLPAYCSGRPPSLRGRKVSWVYPISH